MQPDAKEADLNTLRCLPIILLSLLHKYISTYVCVYYAYVLVVNCNNEECNFNKNKDRVAHKSGYVHSYIWYMSGNHSSSV